ncbi:MAG: hypothetical protein IJV22_00065 [Bacteroidales bacterium]|nr:hypothetical protein [Bacteroidales bacterium]
MTWVADGGSTAVQWTTADRAHEVLLLTGGMNPLTTPEAEISDGLRRWNDLRASYCSANDVLYFYGAGCGSEQGRSKMERLLHKVCGTGLTCHVAGDLLGACRALWGRSAGVVGVLGTGSNACRYDGQRITMQVPSLGYVLGDEGSANHIGRRLLADYLTHRMPTEAAHQFADWSGLDYEASISKLYHQPNPNRFLASLAHFASRHMDNAYVKQLVVSSLEAYFDRQVMPLARGDSKLHLRLTGSVAAVFADELRTVASARGWSIDSIVQSPLGGMASYHASVGEQQ